MLPYIISLKTLTTLKSLKSLTDTKPSKSLLLLFSLLPTP